MSSSVTGPSPASSGSPDSVASSSPVSEHPAFPLPPGGPGVPGPPGGGLLGHDWPEHGLAPRPRLVLAAAATGLLAALVVPDRTHGIGTLLVVLCAMAVVVCADDRRGTPYHRGALALCLLLVSTLVLRDAEWVVALCVLAAGVVAAGTLTGARTLPGLVLSVAAPPLAALQGLPWLQRSLRSGSGRDWFATVRVAVVSGLLLAVFGALFRAADPVFASWTSVLLPDIAADQVFGRAVLAVMAAGVVLATAYVALNPPPRRALGAGQRVTRREWLVPVLVVDTVLAVFVAAQATAMFGGNDYVQRTTGLTYAAYAHQGFWQLTAVTALTLLVVATVVRFADAASGTERVLLRLSLGALCLLSLVVVASALNRVLVYEDAYGFTRLRVLVTVVEGWLGLVLVLVVVAGLRWSGGWLPRTVLLSGATVLLGLALVNPDARIAQWNLDRYAATGRVDVTYLGGLSADAAPVLASSGLPTDCFAQRPARSDDWLEWNLGRHLAGRSAEPGRLGDASVTGRCPVAAPAVERTADAT